MTGSALPSPPTTGDVVDLTVPASPAYVAVVRTATAGLAARVDITLDRIEDLRIAVDEACALLVRGAADHAELTADDVLRCRFVLHEDSLTIEVRGPAVELPQADTFAWSVLSALVDGLESGHGLGPDDDPVPLADGSAAKEGTWLRLVVRRGTGMWA
ncbi:MAG TPA: ATP-binding protein [Actinomycetales bacterium]|nr:ATP-binding protein [Actinomycetales bacterium]